MSEAADGTGGDLDELLAEQAAYYRARAPVYDDWWEGRDTGRRSDELRAAWLAERSRLEADLGEWCAGLAGSSMLELAAGTGRITCLAARHADRLTAVDSSPETLAINSDKLGAARDRVEFVVADLFAWEPPTTYDAVLFGFWISHVPSDHWSVFGRSTSLPSTRGVDLVLRHRGSRARLASRRPSATRPAIPEW